MSFHGKFYINFYKGVALMQQLDYKKTDSKNEVVSFWKDLFPEIETMDGLEQFFKDAYDKELDYYVKLRDLENDNQINYIEKILALNETDKNGIVFSELFNKYFIDYKWIGFFKPLLIKYDGSIRTVITQSTIVKDPEFLIDSLYHQILQNMINNSFRVIVLEVNLARQENLLLGEDSETRYKYFVEKLLINENYQTNLYNKYPELIRVLDKYLENTLNYITEILSHTSKEKQNIFKQMEINEAYLLENIEFSQGDSHNGNKTVTKLTFENDFCLMYKPRPLGIEKAYNELLDWLCSIIPDFKKPYAANVYTKDNYGYMEFIDRKECTDQESVKNFYYKMGELVAILYSLNSKDFHGENIIASGEEPVLIDLETLLHKVEQIDKEKISSYENILHTITNSVASIAILPTTIINRIENLVMEVGAMNSGNKRKSPYKTQVLTGRNTDEIRIENEYKEIEIIDSSPKYNGIYLSADQYIADIKQGFIQIYNWIKENKKIYYEKVVELFSEKESRYIFRSTNNYTQLIETSYHPDLLHNKIDRFIYFHRVFTTTDFENKNDVAMCKTEVEEMLNGDVPMYKIKNNSSDISNMNNNIVMNAEGDSILKSIESRINMFTQNDLKRQVSLINQCFLGSGLKTDIPDSTNTSYVENDSSPIDHRDSIQLAEDLTNSMLERAIRNSHKKTISWIGMKGYGNKYYENLPLEIDLYQGNSGIALTLMAMYKATNKEKYKVAAIECFNYVIEYLDLIDIKDNSLGAFSGLYGALYSLCLAVESKVLPEEDRVVHLLIKKMEESESLLVDLKELDIISGLSGILGALLTMKPLIIENYPQYEATVNRIINTAYIRLVDHAIYVDEQTVKWNENFDSGYAHGSAGIITQLMRLYLEDQDSRKLELIRKSLNYERKYLFNQEEMKWKIRNNTHYFSWCNGIGGILLSKVYLLKSGYMDDKLEFEIHLLKDQLKVCGFGYDKSLCHGDLGSLILLECAGSSINDVDTVRASNQLIYEVSQNHKRLKEKLSYEIEDWGLLTGTSGVTLSLLNSNDVVDIVNLFLLENPNLGG